jgi:hypothetical protein
MEARRKEKDDNEACSKVEDSTEAGLEVEDMMEEDWRISMCLHRNTLRSGMGLSLQLFSLRHGPVLPTEG